MPRFALQIPPGFYRNGTLQQSASRWVDGNLVRWVDNTMVPIGGWRELCALPSGAYRKMLAWRDNSSDRHLVVGSNQGLVVVTSDWTTRDITPGGFRVGRSVAGIDVTYGSLAYGRQAYGIKRKPTGKFLPADTWSLDTFGETLVGVCTSDKRLVAWDLTSPQAEAVPNAPACKACVVTPERMVMALAAGAPGRVAWCHREDMTTWAPTATNTAGDFDLQTVGELMCGVVLRGQTLLLTDVDAFVASFIGGQLVYGFQRVGDACGVASRNAVAAVPGGAVWLGVNGFWHLNGQQVQALKSDVSEYVLRDINVDQVSQTTCFNNSLHNEAWWFYCSGNSTVIDKYVSFNYVSGVWATGYFGRTAAIPSGSFSNPLAISPSGALMEHEVKHGYGGAVPWAQTGIITIGDGEFRQWVSAVVPDETPDGVLSLRVDVLDDRVHDAVVETHDLRMMGGRTDTRFSARSVRLKVWPEAGDLLVDENMNFIVDSDDDRLKVANAQVGDWSIGRLSFEAKPAGKR